MAIPKPKQCNQGWLDMKPTEGGRICSACEKTIVDFSRMKWKEIELIQTENSNSVCGMYTDRQLNNWGEEPKRSFLKLPSATASSLILMLAQLTAGDSVAQTTLEIQIVEDSTVRDASIVEIEDTVSVVLKGQITNENDAPLSYLRVRIKSSSDLQILTGAYTDEYGQYSIDLRYPMSTIQGFIIEVGDYGQMLEDDLSNAREGVIERNYKIPSDLGLISFSVPYRSKWQEKRYDRRLKRQDKKNEE
ncbi:MAG: hypothetical protein ACJA0U_001350 [Salibacteraceae bacterium]|jgi:hypothetical protein